MVNLFSRGFRLRDKDARGSVAAAEFSKCQLRFFGRLSTVFKKRRVWVKRQAALKVLALEFPRKPPLFRKGHRRPGPRSSGSDRNPGRADNRSSPRRTFYQPHLTRWQQD